LFYCKRGRGELTITRTVYGLSDFLTKTSGVNLQVNLKSTSRHAPESLQNRFSCVLAVHLRVLPSVLLRRLRGAPREPQALLRPSTTSYGLLRPSTTSYEPPFSPALLVWQEEGLMPHLLVKRMREAGKGSSLIIDHRTSSPSSLPSGSSMVIPSGHPLVVPIGSPEG
jgi:hypothetical protein